MAPETPDRIDAPLVRVALVLVLGTFMATLDATIVTVGIDTLAGELNASVAEIHWVSTGYLLAVVAVLPVSGWLAERFGGRPVWLAAVVGFVIGSLLCALAWSATSLIVFRVIQGLCGGLLPPVGQALLARTAGPRRIGKVISIVAVIPLLAPAFGPVVGGALLAAADWRWLFAINLPVGIGALMLARRWVPSDPPLSRPSPLDVRGLLLLSPGLSVLVFGLSGITDGTAVRPAVVVASVVAGVVMLVVFVLHGLWAHRSPLLDPRLLVRTPFGAAAFVVVVGGAVAVGSMFVLPLYLQAGRGLTAWEAGQVLAAQGGGALVGAIVVNRTIDRFQPRTLVLVGMMVIAATTMPFTRVGDGLEPWIMVAVLAIRGMGVAMVGSPLMAGVYRQAAPAELPRVAGTLNLLHAIGGAVGTAMFAVILHVRLLDREPLGETGAALAFADTFWVVFGCCAVGVALAARMPRDSSSARPRAGAIGGSGATD